MPLCICVCARNVKVVEAMVTVLLAVLVCIVAALLLATGFYQDFWAFWFCFVVATAHFSLIKVYTCMHILHSYTVYTDC